MANFFLDNSDIQFHFKRFNMQDVVAIAEEDYEQSKHYSDAPINYEDAMTNYYKVLEMVGDLAANRIAARAADVDREGVKLHEGRVRYAKGTEKNLKELGQSDLMGMVFPRKYGGLNSPFTIYMMAVEMVSRADASMMNLFGLQDIGDTIRKFGTEEQREEFLPGFCSGTYTGAMALTEPDAGSDLQAIKLQAYQIGDGKWFLRGVKRFITNGNGDILLVLARSEPGSKDGRGLSLFICRGADGVKVRRLENKLGIHGSPTCELQFNDTPAQLLGARRFGLIKYVLDLMYRARMGVSAQALGISQAAYEEALAYAKERIQFGKSIYTIPAVSNMLIDMRVELEANRSLFYSAALSVDRKEKLEERIERLKAQGRPVAEEAAALKKATKIANLLTPLTKYVLTESANRIAYDAMQIHGGTGYMKEFRVERLVRDARITNIYEGTSQLQVVAAAGLVASDILHEYFDEKEKKEYRPGMQKLAVCLKEIRELFHGCLSYLNEKNDEGLYGVSAKDLVELYSYLFVGYLLLDEAENDSVRDGSQTRKAFVVSRYVRGALARARKNAQSIKSEMYLDLLHADSILAGTP
jgi:alkylation response protein AidB-like acyl-CoA dehydrogenase